MPEGSKLAKNSRVGPWKVQARISSLRWAVAESPNRYLMAREEWGGEDWDYSLLFIVETGAMECFR